MSGKEIKSNPIVGMENNGEIFPFFLFITNTLIKQRNLL